MRKIGLVVNPIAGMGGRVGLKGTDGKVEKARELGAEKRSPQRAIEALESLKEYAHNDIKILTYGGEMGAVEALEAGFSPVVVGEPESDETTAEDTKKAVRKLAEESVELILFVGGDGTAVDVSEPLETITENDLDSENQVEELDEADVSDDKAEESNETNVSDDQENPDVDEVESDTDSLEDDTNDVENETDESSESQSDIPVLGVPAGVKVYSSVFSVNPKEAGRISAQFERVEKREINDIDEEAYRDGEVRTELRGVANVPVDEKLQSNKQISSGTVEGAAEAFSDSVESETTYILGPGSTVGAIKQELGFEGSPLGVDVWRDGELLIEDANENQILDALGDKNMIVVSPIGGQGFIFGRGNQQISPAVIEKSDVEVVASRSKINETGVLRVDTGEEDIDNELRGWMKVLVGRNERRLVQVE